MAFEALKNPDQRAAFFICVIATPVCIVLTILRFTTAKRVARKIGLEDWLALVALFFYLVWVAFALASVIIENGRNVLELGSLPIQDTLGLIKSGYIINSVYPINQTAAKLSLLILYYRIFGSSQGFARLTWAVAILQILWFIPNFVERLLVCNPPAKLWNPELPGFCVNSNAFVAATESFNSLLDFVMVGMAVYMVQKLKIRRADKVKLIVLFVLGGFSGVVGIIKIAQAYGTVDVDGTDLPWLLIQQATAVICCSAPLYRTILPDFHLVESLRSTFFSGRGSSGGSNLHSGGSGSRNNNNSNNNQIASFATIGQKRSNEKKKSSWETVDGEEWVALGDSSSSTRELATRAWADTESTRSANEGRGGFGTNSRSVEIEQTVHHISEV